MSRLSPKERAIAAVADAQAESYENTIASLRAQLAEYGIRIKHLEVELAKSDDDLRAQLAERDKTIEALSKDMARVITNNAKKAETIERLREAPLGWDKIETAPKDGSMLDLIVVDAEHPLENERVFMTIGHNNFDNDEIDRWQMAGWCWMHDHFTEELRARPLFWRRRQSTLLELLQKQADALQEEADDTKT